MAAALAVPVAYRPSVGNGVAGADHRPPLAGLCLSAARPGFLLTRLGWNASLVAALGAVPSINTTRYPPAMPLAADPARIAALAQKRDQGGGDKETHVQLDF